MDKLELNELPALLAEELASIDGLNPVTRDIIRGILDDAVTRVVELEADYAEENRLRAEAAARAAELERVNGEFYRAYLKLKEEDDAGGEDLREACRQNMILTARVAKLEAALAAERAAHAWRPVTEPPVVTMQYQVVVQHSRQQPTADHMAYYPSSGWTGTDVIFWRPIPPLPPAPDAQEPTP